MQRDRGGAPVSATILCADDDRGFCQILARSLGQAGYQVETAHDGATAIEKVRALRPALLTLDVMLPRLDGFSVLEAIRADEQIAATPVVFVSGCTFTTAYEERAKQLAAAAVVKKPVPLDKLLALVQRAVHGKAAKAKREIALAGRIEQLPFAELLHHLHGLRASGVLELVHGKKKKQLQLNAGIPEAVRSNLMAETLGHLLVASGTLTEDVLAAYVERMEKSGGMLGQILLASQMLDEEDLARALRRQADEKLYELFSWGAGQFHFHRGARIKSANALYLNRSPAELILQGVLERMPLAAIETRLAERARCVPVTGGSGFYQFQGAPLDAQGSALLARVDGKRTLAELGAGSERARRMLYALIALEIIELDEPGAPGAQDAPGWRAREVQRRNPSSEARAPEGESPALREELSALADRLRGPDPWAALGVPRSAGDDQIREAYADLAKRTHPDRFIGASDAVHRLAEEAFAHVSAAYDAIRDEEARAAFARAKQQQERDAEAREESERAVFAEREFVRGEQLLRAKRAEDALQHFGNALEAYPEEGEYHVYYGWAYYLAAPEAPGRLGKAIQIVMKGRKLAPDRRAPYLILGRLSQAAGRVDTAEKMYARAIQIDPSCVEAVRELRLVRMRQDKAKGIVKRILRR